LAILEKAAAKASRQHTVYKLTDGTKVPGVTTILGVINKPALVKWANNLGLQGFDSAKYVDATARIGTCAHELVQEYLGGNKVDRGAYTLDEIDGAENALISFFAWEKMHGGRMETLHIELPLVSEQYHFGGTIDWYGLIDGLPWLVDFKTTKGVFPEHEYQVSAYHKLLLEKGYPVHGVRLLRIGRTEDEGFSDHIMPEKKLAMGWDVFMAARALYCAQKSFEEFAKMKF